MYVSVIHKIPNPFTYYVNYLDTPRTCISGTRQENLSFQGEIISLYFLPILCISLQLKLLTTLKYVASTTAFYQHTIDYVDLQICKTLKSMNWNSDRIFRQVPALRFSLKLVVFDPFNNLVKTEWLRRHRGQLAYFKGC